MIGIETDRDSDDDRAVVARATAGDRDAVDALVRRHQNWIYNVAVRMLSHPHDAQDATQEILITGPLFQGAVDCRNRSCS